MTCSRYDGELVVEYDSGEKTFVALSASAGGVDVYLSTRTVQLEPAYIGLSRFVVNPPRMGIGKGPEAPKTTPVLPMLYVSKAKGVGASNSRGVVEIA